MANNYFDFLEQNSIESQPASGDKNEGVVNLTVRADAECQVVCDGDFLFLLNANQLAKEKAPVGQHILKFISTEDPDVFVDKVVDFSEVGKNYCVIVNELQTKIHEKENQIVTIGFTAKLGGKGSYTGRTRHGKPTGMGKIVFESGSVYEGYFQDGWRHGRGGIPYE